MKPKNEILIFIVEDDEIYSSLVHSFLHKKGYTNIKVYSTGDDCIENLFLIPDIIIMDYQLGEMNGIDVLRKVKAFDPDIHVMFMSGQNSVDVAVNSLKYGSIDYILKDENALTVIADTIDKIFNNIMNHKKKSRFNKLRTIFLSGFVLMIAAFVIYYF